MNSIPEFMTSDHRRCDTLFNDTEAAIGEGDWDRATINWRAFHQAVELHFRMEEEQLFPAFEQATGNTAGPTAVMRMEHQQMRQLFAQIEQTMTQHDADELLGLTETLMILMQQHNMKEEQVLYPMAQQMLPDSSATLKTMQTC